jgi:membrane associated rhomboid family serine protease
VIPLRDDNPTARRAVVTILLLLVNIGIYFLIQLPKSEQADTVFTYKWAGVPCEVHDGQPIEIVPASEPIPADQCAVGALGIQQPEQPFPDKNVYLAVVYSMFLHGSVLHVLGNMLFLWIFGNNVEDQLGPVAFLAFYLVGGIVASVVHIIGNIDSTTPFVGASGAIAAVMGAYIVWFPKARVLTLLGYIILPLPAALVLGIWFVLQFFTQSSSGIATLAHIGGFVFGALVAFLLARIAHLPRVRHARTS